MMTKTQRSPFKFLDPYGPEDSEIFFGRKEEVDQLYTKLYSSPITVVYGESGTGKTSLIQCGLRSRIPPEDMLFVSVRIANKPEIALRSALIKVASQAADENQELGDLLRYVIRRNYKTILLVFDQFEEFLLFQAEDVQLAFATQLGNWIDEGLNLRLLFVIRQEFLAQMTALEKQLPDLYKNRMWLQRMSREKAEIVIVESCDKVGIGIARNLIDPLLDALNTRSQGIDLPTLQVVLDSLYLQAMENSKNSSASLELNLKAYSDLGQIDNILGCFLNECIVTLGEKADTAKDVLKTLVTFEATRRPATQQDIHQQLIHRAPPIELSEAQLSALLETLINKRILRKDPDRHYYELRHDSLAPHVRSWMSLMEQDLESFRDSLKLRFRQFQRYNHLLDAPFLDKLAPYEKHLQLKGELAKLVQDSKDKLEEEIKKQRLQQKWRRNWIYIISILSTILFAGLGMFYYEKEIEAEKYLQVKNAATHGIHDTMQVIYKLYKDPTKANYHYLELLDSLKKRFPEDQDITDKISRLENEINKNERKEWGIVNEFGVKFLGTINAIKSENKDNDKLLQELSHLEKQVNEMYGISKSKLDETNQNENTGISLGSLLFGAAATMLIINAFSSSSPDSGPKVTQDSEPEIQTNP